MKTLYFICPADNIEHDINKQFKTENYFYTSLGNSIALNENSTLEQIKYLIESKNITKIFLVLSDENPILLDAINKQNFSGITGLKELYVQLLEKKEHAETYWRTQNGFQLILSYHLNAKIKELGDGLKEILNSEIEIDGQIYNKEHIQFHDIYSNLICETVNSLN